MPKTSSNSAVPLSQIEKSVTHLLVATKQLLETLTQWSRGQATDTQVSDVYVRLGYEFNMACRAFTAINVDTSDLGNVPELLRNILEATLSQEASVESLEKYLPRIRDIIINLLHGLKRKQQKLRQKQAREKDNGVAGEPNVGRTTSTSTTGSVSSGLTNLINEGLDNGYRPDLRPDESTGRPSSSPSRKYTAQRDQSQGSINSEQSSLSSNTLQNMPVMPPYPGDDATIPSGPSAGDLSNLDSFPPPPPPPKGSGQSALAALQRGGDLERRASRRYSAYQISKHLGSGANGVPMLPPQNTPIPNRGRGEVRESMRAVQVRETLRHNRNNSSLSRSGALDSSPVRVPSRVNEEKEVAELAAPESPTVQTPEDKYPKPSATLKGPPTDEFPIMGMAEDEAEAKPAPEPEPKTAVEEPPPPEKREGTFMLEASPPMPTKELTLFLQYKSKVKKFVLPEGYSELSIGRLQLAFIEKFSWNTHANGSDLPEIYIQDPISGVRHELEDLSDIKDRTVLVLNIEALDEVKRHIDEGLGSIKKVIEEVKQNVDDQGAALQRVSDRQQEAAKEMARLAAAPPTPPADSPRSTTLGPVRKLKPGQMSEIQTLRRDLAVLRQTYSNFQSEIQGSMTMLRNKANNVKVSAAKVSIPDVDGDTGHAYVAKGRKQLNTDSDRLVTKVDDLQDMVEDLRKDVVHRGVRPRPRQLETVAKDIQLAMKELKKMDDYMKKEKPVWTKIWEKELEDVCQGRDELRLMEDLMVDLQDDLEKATETFALVEQATKEQMKDAGATTGTNGPAGLTGRLFSRGLDNIAANAAVDPNAAKEGVLGQVRALQPNHENRLEAIERAEKLRQKELETRRDNPLKKELTTFVEEGKLKKSGGFEEVERARKAKDDRIRREVWERQNGMIPENPVGEGEAGEASPSAEAEPV
ncbi:putative actin interacting protein 3 protein [Phaeoacremonium minimum UCRPA7]|uniref:Putative actin interacting protein 3 protein n=1 Tax=Phaeoacremonium minimum (strain UCR-PA7) TaxID=1286976 RepID=R8BRG5_PHAM7|nr:putative actin interacting protein 3 protein [Phaeoacremonium minimum UCRPA7]EOO01875.1 putative actin interacting protein 3 protein [Phaeoacremonium minimum UCRPA7]